MKKSIFITVIVIGALLLFSQCRKDDTTFNAHFYANWSATDAPLGLYIDGEYKGDLSYLKIKPTCDDDSLKSRTLNLTLKSGKYKIETKDQLGVVRTSSKILLSERRISTSGGIGGQEIIVDDKCAMIGVTE